MPNKTNQAVGWEEKFKIRFGAKNYPYIDGNAGFGELDDLWKDVKSFIRQTIKVERIDAVKKYIEQEKYNKKLKKYEKMSSQ